VCLVATLVQRILFIAIMAAAQVSPNVFLPSGWLLADVQVNKTTQHNVWYTAPIHTTVHDTYTHFFIHHIHAYIYTLFFTCLLFFVAGWLPFTLDVLYKYIQIETHQNIHRG
jgi:hypothetical protein